MEKIAKIKFGKTRFELYINQEIQNFISEKDIEIQKLIPSANSWYKTILNELHLDSKDEKEIKVLFFRNKIKEIKKTFKPEKILQSPLRVEDGEYLLKIGVKNE
jgi:hypothetical protein